MEVGFETPFVLMKNAWATGIYFPGRPLVLLSLFALILESMEDAEDTPPERLYTAYPPTYSSR